MKTSKSIKKLLVIITLISSCGLFARGGHGSGHHGGGRHGEHHSRHHSGGNHSGRHHGGHHGDHAGHHGYHGYRGYHGGWSAGWGRGYPGWAWGATAALVAGNFLFGGYTYAQWQAMAAQDPEKRYYFQTVVVPAYQKYQQDPSSIPSYDEKGNAQMSESDAELMETNIDYYQINSSIRRCCTDANSNWYNAGPDRAWREENLAPGNFSIYRRSEFRPASFTDLAEQPQTSGFETSVYTSPK